MIKLDYFNKILFYVILYSVPLNAVITNRIHPLMNIVIYVVILIIFLLTNKNLKINKVFLEIPVIAIILLTILLISNFIHILFFTDNLYYTMLISFPSIFALLIFVFISKVKFDILDLKAYLNYVLLLSFFILFYDNIILNLGLDFSYQVVYRGEGSVNSDMVWRPHGLVGQPSVNATIIIFSYMIREYIVDTYDNILKKENYFYFFIMFFSIILQKSGIGFFMFLFIFLPYFFSKVFRIFFLIFFIILLYYLLISNFLAENLLHKLSTEYLMAFVVYFEDIINLYINQLSIGILLFGGDSMYDFPIDFGILYIVYHVGLIFLLFYTLLVIYLLYLEKNLYFRSAFIMIFISSLHYPVIIYPYPAIIIFLLLYIIKNERLKYENYHNRS